MAATSVRELSTFLPPEIHMQILEFLSGQDLSNMARASRQWRALCETVREPRSQLCIEAVDAAAKAFDAEIDRLKWKGFPRCEDIHLLARDRGIQIIKEQSATAQLRGYTRFFLSIKRDDWGVNPASEVGLGRGTDVRRIVARALMSSVEGDSPKLTHALLNSEIHICVDPKLMVKIVNKAASAGRLECLSSLLRQQDIDMQDPRYLRIYASAFTAGIEGIDVVRGSVGSLGESAIYTSMHPVEKALSGGHTECAALLLKSGICIGRTGASVIKELKSVRDTSQYPQQSLDFMESISNPQK